MKRIVLVSLSAVIFGYAQDFAKVGLGVIYKQQSYKGTEGEA